MSLRCKLGIHNLDEFGGTFPIKQKFDMAELMAGAICKRCGKIMLVKYFGGGSYSTTEIVTKEEALAELKKWKAEEESGQ